MCIYCIGKVRNILAYIVKSPSPKGSSLGNDDFSEESARKAACLNPKTFRETLATIRLVLATHEKSSKRLTSYEDLVKDYDFAFPEFMELCMRTIEDELLASGKLKKQFTPPHNTVTMAVFIWVCMGLKVRFPHEIPYLA